MSSPDRPVHPSPAPGGPGPLPDWGVDAVVFDIGDTLVVSNPPATATDELVVETIGPVARQLAALGRHVQLGAVTDTAVMREPEVRALLTPPGIDAHLPVVVTSVDVGEAKPSPVGIVEAARRLGVDTARVLYVGDRDIDGEAAQAAGAQFVAVRPGVPAVDVVGEVMAERLGAFTASAALVADLDEAAGQAARDRHGDLTKPPGSLGRVEDLGVQLAAIAGSAIPPVPHPAAVAVFAGDHGVVAQGVTPWPSEVTGLMVHNFTVGGAAINALAAQVGASVTVVDVGVASDVADAPGLLRRRVRSGTADLSQGPAMAPEEVRAALDLGAEVARQLVADGARALVTGEMGIGNTTAAAAVIAALTGRSAASVVGPGAGADADGVARKVAAVEAGLARLHASAASSAAAAAPVGQPQAMDRAHPVDPAHPMDPLAVLAEVGGLEIAALAGFIVGGAAARVPVVVDGVITQAALLAAVRLCPAVLGYVVAGHRSTEPGSTAVLEELDLAPVLDLALRLGEGTGAALALPVLEAAANVLTSMATFADLGIER